MVGGKLLESPGDTRSPVSTISRIFAAEILADAGDRAQLRFAERGEPLGGVRDGLRGVPVRANLERVLALDFEEIGDLSEDARDGQVFHDSTRNRSGVRTILPGPTSRSPSVSIR